MERDSAVVPARWRQSAGTVLSIAGVIALAAILWQLAGLNGVEGLPGASVARERLAVSEAAKILRASDAVGVYRDASALGTAPSELSSARASLQAAMGRVRLDYTRGAAASLDVRTQWRAADTAYRTLVSAPAATAHVLSGNALARLQALIDATGDATNLNYDPNQVAQNYADVALGETTRAYYTTGAARLRAVQFIRSQRITLAQRIRLANDLNALRIEFDLNADRLPEMTTMLARIVPDARYTAIPSVAANYERAGTAFYQFIAGNIVEVQRTSVTEATVDARAAAAQYQARKLQALVAAALDANLVQRGEIQRARQRLVYGLYVCAAVILAGLAMLMGQLVARRSREALRLAQQESMRLSAELARQDAEAALRLSEAQFRTLYDGAAVGIAIVERSGAIVDANNVFRAMFGEDAGSALAGHAGDLAHVFAGDAETFEFEQHLQNAMGQEVWADVTVSAVGGAADAPAYAMCVFRDKTQLKHNERRMQYDKLHDSLTGLPNRQLFEQHLRRRFDEATALLDSFFAVLFVDLEHFKDVNESLGHAAGDVVLTQVAQRLRTSVDPRDVVARLGSDEFAILVQSLGDILHVESIARRILNNVSKTIAIGNRSIYLGASVGIAIGSSAYERAEDVTRDAETAMQHAKSGGGPRYAVFDSKMHQRAQKRLQLTSDIRVALDRNEFRLLYQPIVDLADETAVGCEALIRWDHPVEGVLNPSDFMPIVEQGSLAVPIGRFVLQTAVEQLASLRRDIGPSVPFSMHVNVSAAELVDPEFESTLVQVVEHHGVAPEDLIIEITESVVLDSATRANVTLERVRSRGFNICIDDFGTGYSSLRYLQQFKVDALKIDRMFVSGTDGELASEPIVRTLMTLAEAFDVRVVAEGVETARQRDLLRNAGCRLAQGYLYARPLSATELMATFPALFSRRQSA